MKGQYLNYTVFQAAVVILACMVSACDVHEFPEPTATEPRMQLMLNFHMDNLAHYTTIDMDLDGRSRSTENETHLVRHIIRIFNDDDTRSTARSSRGAVDEMEIIQSGLNKNMSVKLHELPPGDYKVAVWTEYIPEGENCDYYHATADFQNITLLGKAGGDNYIHQGNNPFREAWSGKASITVNNDGEVLSRDLRESVTIEMYRPMARYHLITTDLQEFLESRKKLPQSGDVPDASAEAPGTPAPEAPDLNDYIVAVRYAGYMPYVYNLFTDKPVDSLTGITYTGRTRQIDDNSAELAYDYVLVNGATTSTQVKLELYSKDDGSLIASSDVINVPLVRDKYTLVKGKFLTTTAGGTLGINPNYDGQFNIEIH